ncbi:unnamed protein product [Caretta caretta]
MTRREERSRHLDSPPHYHLQMKLTGLCFEQQRAFWERFAFKCVLLYCEATKCQGGRKDEAETLEVYYVHSEDVEPP